jgi:hypothetical protein
MLAGLSVAACASRAMPMSFPKTSAASAEAREAPAARVGVMLEQDPPLPGEPAGDWRGIAPEEEITTPPQQGDERSPGRKATGNGHEH